MYTKTSIGDNLSKTKFSNTYMTYYKLFLVWGYLGLFDDDDILELLVESSTTNYTNFNTLLQSINDVNFQKKNCSIFLTDFVDSEFS